MCVNILTLVTKLCKILNYISDKFTISYHLKMLIKHRFSYKGKKQDVFSQYIHTCIYSYVCIYIHRYTHIYTLKWIWELQHKHSMLNILRYYVHRSFKLHCCKTVLFDSRTHRDLKDRVLKPRSLPERSSENGALSRLVGRAWSLPEMQWLGAIPLPCLSVLGAWCPRRCLHTMHPPHGFCFACGAITLVFPWHRPYVCTQKYPLSKPHASSWNRGHCTEAWHHLDQITSEKQNLSE